MTTSNTQLAGLPVTLGATLEQGHTHLVTGENGAALLYGDSLGQLFRMNELLYEDPVLTVMLYPEDGETPSEDTPRWDVVLRERPAEVREGHPMTTRVYVANGNQLQRGKMTFLPTGHATLEIHE